MFVKKYIFSKNTRIMENKKNSRKRKQEKKTRKEKRKLPSSGPQPS
jgi:hypothetical protein